MRHSGSTGAYIDFAYDTTQASGDTSTSYQAVLAGNGTSGMTITAIQGGSSNTFLLSVAAVKSFFTVGAAWPALGATSGTGGTFYNDANNPTQTGIGAPAQVVPTLYGDAHVANVPAKSTAYANWNGLSQSALTPPQ
jgi:hypothetical protein